MNIRAVAHALGGEASGNSSVICPGPGHSRNDRSLAVRFSASAPDGFTCHSHAGDDWQECRDHVRERLGLESFKPADPSRPQRLLAVVESEQKPDEAAVKLQAFAGNLWREARPIGGTLAARYLVEARRITLVDEVMSGQALRFHAECPFRLESGETVRLPTMLALMVDIQTNEAVGVHRTALDPNLRGDRGKARVAGLNNPKKMLGRAKGSCCKISPDEAVTYGLNIAEGLETSLSLMSVGIKPMWAMLTEGGIRRMPVLGGIDSLTIYADADQSGTGESAADECGKRWAAAGRECQALIPPIIGNDWNDIVTRSAAA